MRFWLGIAGLSLWIASSARADDAILILDASKSMWGRVQGKTKVEIARAVVGDLLTQIPDDRRLGFVAYGHRRASDCHDIEEIAPVGADRAQIRSSLAALAFKGKTPLTEAVRFAADKLQYTKSKATVILVSDGIESCHADPCAAAAALEKAGVDLTVHVIGFGIKKGEIKGLKCLADATGGTYFSAGNAAELTRALQQTVAKAPMAEPTGGAATLSAPESVVAGARFDVQWTGPNAEQDRIGIALPSDNLLVYAGTRDVLFQPGDTHAQPQIVAPGVPGTYELRYVHERELLAKRSIQVTPAVATLSSPSTLPAGSEFEVAWTGPSGELDSINIARPADRPALFYSVFASTLQANSGNGRGKLRAPNVPGTYELRYVVKEEQIVAMQKLKVVPVSATLNAPSQVVAGAPFEVTWTGPNDDNDSIVLSRPEWSGGAAVSIYANSLSPSHGGGRGEMTAPVEPGKYELRYWLNRDEKIGVRAIEVLAASASVQTSARVQAGAKLAVRWNGPNNTRDWIRLAPSAVHAGIFDSELNAQKAGGTGELLAPTKPGTYELRYILCDELILARQAVVVTE